MDFQSFQSLSSCLSYDVKRDIWSQIADMNDRRFGAACTVYEGKIVVSGGFSSSVEAFDYYENKWTYLPDMIEERSHHASVSIGNKLFVIGGYKTSTCEIFDSLARKFCYMKTCLELGRNIDYFQAVCISSQIIVFGEVRNEHETKMFTYIDETSEWKSIDCKYLNNKRGVSCIKYHS